VKEASASARAIAQPGDHGAATELIRQIAAEADTKEARHDMKEHRGPTVDAAIDGAIESLQPAAAALKKLDSLEAAEVAAWLVDIAQAVAGAAKGVNPGEQAVIDRITALFRVA
jgi:hypothetical protein